MPRIMITGSFDPVTIGHEDIIRRAASIFSDVRVVVFLNPEKPGMFTPEELAEMTEDDDEDEE